MPERILFLTGHLAAGRLRKVLTQMDADFVWEIHDIGIQVAALMTTELIRRRLPHTAITAERIIVPGYCAGDLASLSKELGLPVERGPEDLHDLPTRFGRERQGVDLSRHNVRIRSRRSLTAPASSLPKAPMS